MSHRELIDRFYTAFAKRDGAAMAACYHPEIRFSDPVFPGLVGPEAGAMWKMLCERGTDLRIEHSGVEADDQKGKAHWEAWYTFSTTGRSVHNVIDATFAFEDGLIVEHTDVFDFWRWSRQALGPTGLILGWTPMLRGKVQGTARKGLDKFMKTP